MFKNDIRGVICGWPHVWYRCSLTFCKCRSVGNAVPSVGHFDPDSNICNSWMYCHELFTHAFMVPKIWILITLAIPWMSSSTTNMSSDSVKYLQILMDSLAQKNLQTFMIPRGWILLTLLISWAFPVAPQWGLHSRCSVNMSWQLQDWLPWRFV